MASFACLCFSVTAFAQTWPQRAMKVIAPYPPGGPSDIVIRTVSDKVQAALKQAVIIENIPGGLKSKRDAFIAKIIDLYTDAINN